MRISRPYVQLDPAVIEQARQMDLLSYLRAYEPSNLVRVAGNVYCTKEHDSLKISNGKWYWWSRGIGGVSALDYLIKVKDYGFVEAVEALTGVSTEWIPPPQTPKKDEPKVLLLPPKNKDCNRVMQYLFGRGIDYQLIQDCVADGTVYESADYHNAVFIGRDKSGTPKYAALRSTLGSSFKQDASGSDKRYSFRLLAREPTDTVHLFEAAIDLEQLRNHDWAIFNSDRRYYQRMQETGTYLEEVAEDTTPPEIKTVEDFLDNIENQKLYQVLIKVDRLTLQAVLLQLQGFSIAEIALALDMKEYTVYKRLSRLKEKIKKLLG